MQALKALTAECLFSKYKIHNAALSEKLLVSPCNLNAERKLMVEIRSNDSSSCKLART